MSICVYDFVEDVGNIDYRSHSLKASNCAIIFFDSLESLPSYYTLRPPKQYKKWLGFTEEDILKALSS